jgi:hypothetical protein
MIPGTLFMKYNTTFRYPDLDHAGEDNAFRSQVVKHYSTSPLSGHGHLYIYRVHAKNQCPHSHHEWITSLGCVTPAYLDAHWTMLTDTVSSIPLPMPLHVFDNNGARVHTFNKILA